MTRPRFSIQLLHPKHWGVWLVLGLLWLIVQLPQAARMTVGAGLGKLAWQLKSRRHITQVNIALAFPNMSPAEQEQLARDHLVAVGRGFVEMAMCWWLPEWRCRKLADDLGQVDLDASSEEGGVILPSATCTPQGFSGSLPAIDE